MKQFYKRLSFISKLSFINFSVAIPIVVVAILIGVLLLKFEGKKIINRHLNQIGTLTASIVVSDLLFDDEKAIDLDLENLEVFENIDYACVVNNQNELISSYGMNTVIKKERLIKTTDDFMVDNIAVIYKEIIYKNQRLGKLVFIADVSPFLILINRLIFWLILILCALFSLWLIVVIQFQKIVIKPIIDLSELMDRVVRTGKYDYDLNPMICKDEIGRLYDNFNQLMETIRETTVSKNYVNNVMNALAEMLVVLDEDNRIRTINEMVLKTTDFNLAFLKSKKMDYLIPNCLEEMEHKINFESFIITASDEHIPVAISVTTFINMNEKKRTVLSIKNITEKRVNEAELKQHYAIIEEKNQELAVKNQELERFTYIASHDMKTPLRTIVGFVGLIEHRMKKHTDDKELMEYLTFVKNGAKQLNNLISDTLEFSKMDNKDIEYTEVDLNKTVSWIQKNFDKTVCIESTHLPKILSNVTLLQKVFQNIIENGIKYNESELKRIKISHEIREDKHVFAISDNGIGIDSAYFEKIFVMYKRLHNNEKFQGTGLGLAICKKIVEQLDGNLSLTSEVSKGTTFFIELPRNSIYKMN